MARGDDMRRTTDHAFHRRRLMPGTITVGHQSVHLAHQSQNQGDGYKPV
jgi:hypothetical protein